MHFPKYGKYEQIGVGVCGGSALIQEISLLLILLPPHVQLQLLSNQLPPSLREELTTVLMTRDEEITVQVADAISASQAMVGICIPFLSAFLAGSSWEQLQNKLERFASIDVDEMPTGSDSSATLVVDGISTDDVQAFLLIFLFGSTNNAAFPSKHYTGPVLSYPAARFIVSKGSRTIETDGNVKGGKMTTQAWSKIGRAVARRFDGQEWMQEMVHGKGLVRLVLDVSSPEWAENEKGAVKELLSMFPQRPGFLFTPESKKKLVELTQQEVGPRCSRCLHGTVLASKSFHVGCFSLQQKPVEAVKAAADASGGGGGGGGGAGTNPRAEVEMIREERRAKKVRNLLQLISVV